MLQVRLTEDAREGWDRAAEREGANLTALLEAYGEALSGRKPIRLPASVVQRAREIDRQRHSRRVR